MGKAVHQTVNETVNQTVGKSDTVQIHIMYLQTELKIYLVSIQF